MGAYLGKGLYCDKHKDTAVVAALSGAACGLVQSGYAAPNAVMVFASGLQLGVQFWVGFVAGPTMLFNLEKEVFSAIQSKLFMKYGLLNTAWNSVAAFALYRVAGNSLLDSRGGLCLLTSLACNAANYLYLFPKTVENLDAQNAAKTEEEKAKLKKAFGAMHGISMLINLAATVCGAVFLASRI